MMNSTFRPTDDQAADLPIHQEHIPISCYINVVPSYDVTGLTSILV